MSKKRKEDNRRELLIRYRIDENGKGSFIDPCCDEMPMILFCNVMKAISEVEKSWNNKIDNK